VEFRVASAALGTFDLAAWQMLAVILVIVIGTVRLIGGNANNVFSSVASQVAQ